MPTAPLPPWAARTAERDQTLLAFLADDPDWYDEHVTPRLRIDPDGCWEWLGPRTTDGYGIVRTPPLDRVSVHRLALLRARGPIGPGLVTDHTCRNRLCQRPDHLEAVTNLENVRRGSRANLTHCPVGHPYSDENILASKKRIGHRSCRPCHIERSDRNNRLIRAAADRLGYTRKAYGDRFGYSAATAQAIIDASPAELARLLVVPARPAA